MLPGAFDDERITVAGVTRVAGGHCSRGQARNSELYSLFRLPVLTPARMTFSVGIHRKGARNGIEISGLMPPPRFEV